MLWLPITVYHHHTGVYVIVSLLQIARVNKWATRFGRVVQFGVRSKVRVLELSHISTNHKNAVCELSKVYWTLKPFFQTFGKSKIAARNAGRALDGRHTDCLCTDTLWYTMFIQDNISMFWTSMNQQDRPFSKLHIKLLEQFKGYRTFTNFIGSSHSKHKLNNLEVWLVHYPDWMYPN